MFDDLKQLQEMREQIKNERATGEENGVSVTLNGEFDVEELSLNEELAISEQEDAVKKAFSQAVQNLQKELARKYRGSM